MKIATKMVAAAALSASLSGCVVAAVPLMAAATVATYALVGFGAFKTVQLVSGGSVKVAFKSTDGKKDTPPQSLPGFHKLGVWPGGEREVTLAEQLTASGRFDVATPNAVSRALAASGGGADIRQMTVAEQSAAFDGVCRSLKLEAISAAVDQGEKKNSNILSFNKANTTQLSDLMVYSCREKSVVWRDSMAVVSESGGQVATQSEIAHVAGKAWADRVLQAPKIGS